MNIFLGDCLDVLKDADSCSVDSIITDPPYGLSFMGKRWDYDVPSVEIWKECLRVLKPGGHLLAFAGTRTQHRMAVRIEDAGFEIRDLIAWVYGSGFPKSLDVSKAIDRVNGETGRPHKFTAWMRTTGLSPRQINAATGTFMGSHYLTDKSQPAIPTPELWEIIRPMCGDVPSWVDELVDRVAAEREVVGQQHGNLWVFAPGQNNDRIATTLDITAPATDAARQWQGWGTALKPALEPITVARKPLAGTVAENVLEHGTGAINVDGCRVGGEPSPSAAMRASGRVPSSCKPGEYGDTIQNRITPERWQEKRPGEQLGRWPSNLIHDGSEEPCELLGDAARFFYCAKASKTDRDEQNIHPTVKPTELMRYLCRLVTPPNGIILDPFMGSGSTGKAAIKEGFNFIGIEKNPEYFEIAEKRLSKIQIGLSL